MVPHLQYQVGDEGVCLVLRQVVILLGQRGEEQLQVLQNLHQNCGVGVIEPQREPLQDQVQAANGGLALALHPLSEDTVINRKNPGLALQTSCRRRSGPHLHHDSDGLDLSLEVHVKQLLLQPPGKAGRHLSLQLLHVLVSGRDEVPLQDLRWDRRTSWVRTNSQRLRKVSSVTEMPFTFSCFSSFTLCSLALGTRVKMGPDLSSSSFKPLAAGFLPAAP